MKLFVDIFCILVGIKYDTISKIVGEDPMLEGLHTGPPGFMFVKFPSIFDTFHLPLRFLPFQLVFDFNLRTCLLLNIEQTLFHDFV